MNEVILYLACSSILLLVTWLSYRLFFRGSGHHGINRLYILGMTVFSLFFPLTGMFEMAGAQFAQLSVLEPAQILPKGASPAELPGLNTSDLIFYGYFLGLAVACILFLTRMGRILSLIGQSRRQQEGAIVRVFAGEKVGTSSFFNYLIWDEQLDLPGDELSQLEAHEMCHIRLRHSWDKLGFELLGIVFWFQPLIYILGKDLVEIHEFQADKAALQAGSEASYKRLLLKMVAPQFATVPVHTFATPTIKNRVNMIFSKKRSRNGGLRYLMLIPVFCLMVASAGLFATNGDPVEISVEGGEVTMPVARNLDEVQQKIVFPESLKGSGETYKVFVKILVGKKGEVDKFEFVREDHPEVGAAVRNVIRELKFSPGEQDGKPVKVWVTLPFAFKAPAE